jgi:long-chain acyl-CoA synthetase
VVDGLVARGLVERGSDTGDRRRLPLALTDAGRDLLAQANAAVGVRLAEILGHLDERRANAARASLAHWQTGLDRYRKAKLQHQAGGEPPAASRSADWQAGPGAGRSTSHSQDASSSTSSALARSSSAAPSASKASTAS